MRFLSRSACWLVLLSALGCAAKQKKLSVQVAGPLVSAAIARGDYAEAVTLTERTELPSAERDHAVGQLVLEAYADAAAARRPSIDLEGGIRRLERSALAGSSDAASSLRALFHTGLSQAGENRLLEPVAALEACWRGVESDSGSAASCVELRTAAR
jgi:hypothetical protein